MLNIIISNMNQQYLNLVRVSKDSAFLSSVFFVSQENYNRKKNSLILYVANGTFHQILTMKNLGDMVKVKFPESYVLSSVLTDISTNNSCCKYYNRTHFLVSLALFLTLDNPTLSIMVFRLSLTPTIVTQVGSLSLSDM